MKALPLQHASVIINIHREGALLVPTLRSLALAKKRATDSGYHLEVLAIADNADESTLAVAEKFTDLIDRIIPATFGDLGAAREFGIAQASHDWVFLHDGDDLFSSNWYLQFFDMAARGKIDERTVYHTALFARFGTEKNIRQMIDSWDTRFHPLFLASEWYYSNKSVLNRKLFDETPMPYNNKHTGIGNEDWTWSCHTIQKEIRHYFLPETICFYRMKPAHSSLGLTPGMIHDASPLFEPDSVVQVEIRRAERADKPLAFCDSITKKGEPVLGDGPPPGWFWEEVGIQGEFESLITDYRGMPPGSLRTQLPNLNYNVASATQYLMRDMDARPKIFIFASANNMRAADKVIELMLSAAAAYNNQSHQPVLVVDEGDLVFSDFGLMGRFGAKVISTGHISSYFKIEDWYFNRLLMRPLVQNQGAILIDLGSDIFHRLFTEFHRVLLENFTQTIGLLPDTRLDPLSPALINIGANSALAKAHGGKPYTLIAQPDPAEALSQKNGWQVASLTPDILTAFNSITRHRFRAINGTAGFDLSDLLTAQILPTPKRLPAHLRIPRRLKTRSNTHGEITLSRLTLNQKQYFLYQSENSWVAHEWYEEAHLFLQNNAHIWLVPPQISLSLQESGTYKSRWHNHTEPHWVFSSWYDQLASNETAPLVILARELISNTPPASAKELAALLYAYSRKKDKLVSACNETVAIAMPSEGAK
ncbi:MAG: glycosyltransferase [Rhodobacteraceae bacterium]|nr:glycosyltransferase [Paracoccaceae bacterium]